MSSRETREKEDWIVCSKAICLYLTLIYIPLKIFQNMKVKTKTVNNDTSTSYIEKQGEWKK
jgi:hypothetical protein